MFVLYGIIIIFLSYAFFHSLNSSIKMMIMKHVYLCNIRTPEEYLKGVKRSIKSRHITNQLKGYYLYVLLYPYIVKQVFREIEY